jgi:hypothetical protein
MLSAAVMCTVLIGNAQTSANGSSTPVSVPSTVSEYRTVIYTSGDLADELQQVKEDESSTRGSLAGDIFGATLNAAKGIGSGYVSTFVDMGVSAVASLITRNSRLKQEWEQTVATENTWSTSIQTIQDVKDFYRKSSEAGALDPMDMAFDGIGCMRMEGQDTVFFVSCHIDRSKLNRIVNHSKFELVLDTLIVSPYHSKLPNSQLPLSFSFDDRKNFNLSMNIKLSSSWFTESIELHDNTQLGEFTVTIPVNKESLGRDGYLRYVRKPNETSAYEVVGESFIVPRSYMGYRDKTGRFQNVWGTGQYKLDITLSETCDITDAYRNNWKEDRKMRNNMKPKSNVVSTIWQTVSKQKWNEITQQWVITTLTAPAGVISNELIEKMGLGTGASTGATSATGAGAAAMSGAQPNAGGMPTM